MRVLQSIMVYSGSRTFSVLASSQGVLVGKCSHVSGGVLGDLWCLVVDGHSLQQQGHHAVGEDLTGVDVGVDSGLGRVRRSDLVTAGT